MKSQPARIAIVLAVMLAVCFSSMHAQQSGKKEHAFRGNQITAKVYDGDFKTLHDVQVVPATNKK